MITNIFLVCLPLSTPSFYLSYKLWRKDFLGTLLNQQMALMLLISGNLQRPFHFSPCYCGLNSVVSSSLLRSVTALHSVPCHTETDLRNGSLAGRIFPFLTGDLRSPATPGVNLHRHLALYEHRLSIVQVRAGQDVTVRGTKFKIFRSVLVKYPDRGLVNGDSKLFSYLFWISNFFCVIVPEANKIGIYLSRNKNVFANTYRLATFDQI